MLPHFPLWDLAKARQLKLLQQAERAQLHELARAHRLSRREHFLLKFGDLLVRAGQKLGDQHGSVREPVGHGEAARSG